MNEDYYQYMLEHCVLENGLHRANVEALICLKAKAYLEIEERITNGSKEDSKQLSKHKGDIFRLAVMLTEVEVFQTPAAIHQNLLEFANAISGKLPDKAIYKEMGLGNVAVEKVFAQLLKSFGLEP